MKAIIIEDEELSATHLKYLLNKLEPSIEIVGVYDSIKSSVSAFKSGVTSDLLFLDIHLADGLSFEIFTQQKIEIPIIFTTAYDEYAIKAFRLNSIDYLLKPIGIEELKAALDKFKKYRPQPNTEILDTIATMYQSINKQFKNRFLVKSGENIASIKVEDIGHFISEDGMVLLVTNSGKRYIIDYTLESLEPTLSPEYFFRISRKVILHIDSIKKVSSYFNSRLKLNAPHLAEADAVVSRERVSDFKSWLDR